MTDTAVRNAGQQPPASQESPFPSSFLIPVPVPLPLTPATHREVEAHTSAATLNNPKHQTDESIQTPIPGSERLTTRDYFN
jgi:hypothetical protein